MSASCFSAFSRSPNARAIVFAFSKAFLAKNGRSIRISGCAVDRGSVIKEEVVHAPADRSRGAPRQGTVMVIFSILAALLLVAGLMAFGFVQQPEKRARLPVLFSNAVREGRDEGRASVERPSRALNFPHRGEGNSLSTSPHLRFTNRVDIDARKERRDESVCRGADRALCRSVCRGMTFRIPANWPATTGTFRWMEQRFRKRPSMYKGGAEMYGSHARTGPCRAWFCEKRRRFFAILRDLETGFGEGPSPFHKPLHSFRFRQAASTGWAACEFLGVIQT